MTLSEYVFLQYWVSGSQLWHVCAFVFCFLSPHISLTSDPCVRRGSFQKTLVKTPLLIIEGDETRPDLPITKHQRFIWLFKRSERPFSPKKHCFSINVLASYARPPTVSFSFSKKTRWSCATSVSTNDYKKKKRRSECNNVPPESTDPGHSHAKSPRVGRIHVFLPLMDIHDCVSMRMGLILSQMPRLKERVWWTKPTLHNLICRALESNPALHSNRASSVGFFQVHKQRQSG